MILLLGASGYTGQAFAGELHRRRCLFVPLTRRAMDYTQFDVLFDYVRKMKPAFIINAAGYTGRPNVEACDLARAETLYANTLLPQTISRVCLMTNTPWGHVSSGCIYRGAKVVADGHLQVERDLGRPELRRLFLKHPQRFRGFTEADEPNCSFLYPPCSFYSGTKALAEEAINGVGQCYVWRPGIPFNERDHPRNFLSLLQESSKVYAGLNSLSHLDDFAVACLDLWERSAPFGIYNVTNPGAMTTRQVAELVQRIFQPGRRFDFEEDGEASRHFGVEAPRPNCILDSSKLLAAGVKLRPVRDAVEDALRKWRPATQIVDLARGVSQRACW